jgi:hypothetical protein
VFLLVEIILDLAANGLSLFTLVSRQHEGSVVRVHTSSLLDCLARLALSVEPPASEPPPWPSKAGRGMFEGLLKLTVPRDLGVPLRVPADDIVSVRMDMPAQMGDGWVKTFWWVVAREADWKNNAPSKLGRSWPCL